MSNAARKAIDTFAAAPPPPLDVELLAFAIHTYGCMDTPVHHGFADRSNARMAVEVAAEYARLAATPTTETKWPSSRRSVAAPAKLRPWRRGGGASSTPSTPPSSGDKP